MGDGEAFVNERLFPHLRVQRGYRQFILTGEVNDEFFVNYARGLQSLTGTLTYYAVSEAFEIVVFLDSEKLGKPQFLDRGMRRLFEQTVRGESVDPEAQDHTTQTFQPRPLQGGSRAPAADRSQGENERGRQEADQATEAGVSAEQAMLDQISRLLSSNRKSMVVVEYPENLWLSDPTDGDLNKLKTMIKWCGLRNGHPQSCSLLIVNPNRMPEFSAWADKFMDRDSFTHQISVPPPDRREMAHFIRRVLCRRNLYGSPDRLAAASHSQDMNLHGLAETISRFIRENPQVESLDELFADGERGHTLEELLEELDNLIGLEPVKAKVKELIAVANDQEDRRRAGKRVDPMSYHMFFLGNPGTGKTIVARLIGQIFWALGLRSNQAFVEISQDDIISAYNPGDSIANMKKAVDQALGGVLFIDEIYLLAENDWGKKALETLMTNMENHRDSLTVIMAGYEERLPELFKVNPGFKSRVNHTLRFPDYNTDELVQMFEMRTHKADFTLTPPGREKLHRYIDSFSRRGGMGNGRGVRNLFEKTRSAIAQARTGSSDITPGVIPDPICFREDEAHAVLEELDKEFIGLARVKKFLHRMFIRQRGSEAKGTVEVGFNHCVFLGNPGTGKTSIARRMGKLFYYMGLISERDKLVEVDGINDMTSKYQAEYAEKVRDCFDRARGGVLFIDEAYQLAQDEQGQKVINQIVKVITEGKYQDLVVILAGYPDEMKDLYKQNPGLKRRFPHEVEFDDFSMDELLEIFDTCLQKDKHQVSEAERHAFDARLRSELERLSHKRYFGNAGAVQKLYREIKSNQEQRIYSDSSADKFEFRLADLTDETDAVESIGDILDELEGSFVGMHSLKRSIRRLAQKFEFEKKQQALRPGTSRSKRFYNMRFVGNPGTGKTTIARCMAGVFHSLGIVAHKRVLEYRGVDLKGSYVGQTKDKVNELFEKASGALVLLDEVYSLCDRRAGQADSFGQEAIDTLVGCITDPKNEGVVIILAGYKDRMDEFLNTNPGLASRFPNEIEFSDYSIQDCVAILFLRLEQSEYVYPREDPEFCEAVREVIAHAKASPHFGNARAVGTIFARITDNLADRIQNMDNPQPEEYFRISMDDIRPLLEE